MCIVIDGALILLASEAKLQYDLNLGYFTIIAKQPTGIEPLEHRVYVY